MKWIRLFLVCWALLIACAAQANHLVGGEFQLKHVNNFTYDISLNVYGDVAGLTGPQGNEDPSIEVSIFNKQTNTLVETFTISNPIPDFVAYNNTACQTGSVQTKILSYQLRRQFLPSVYDSPGGYFIVWERCCRNLAVVNILQPGNSGLVYYAEFPAVVKNGQAFVNSLPEFPPMPPDYLCVQELYQYSLRATDADGDSLVYSLTQPLKGHTSSATVTTPGALGPYVPVDWAAGYNLNNQILGTPALTINSRSGLLSVRPNQAGLFVFAVKCEEFRNGVKIGEVHRDIQVKVNNCITNVKPTVQVNVPGSSQNYQQGDTLIVSKATNFCYQFSFSDQNVGQIITVKVESGNTLEQPQITPASGTVVANGQKFSGQICWAACNPTATDSIFKMNIIATDNACGTVASDTLKLVIKVIRTENILPQITIQGNTDPITVGGNFHFQVVSSDANNDQLTVQMQAVGFDPAAQGMQLGPLTGQGQVVSDFNWSTNCGQEVRPDGYDLAFIVKDNACPGKNADTTFVRLKVLPAPKDTTEFLPPNIFTPNNDGRNDFFVMPVLPQNNCSDTFQEIRIFSRWGTEIFKSASRQFAWDGNNVSDGTYFYIIRYRNQNFKGYVTIVR
jgi:gliding motility-associated-like protein